MPMQLQHQLKHTFQKSNRGAMSRHRSYGKSSKVAKKRNVLKRFERIDLMKERGRWKEGVNKKVTGLPKTLVPQ